MKRAGFLFLIMGLVTILVAAICQAPPQADPPRLYLMGDFLVDASRAGDYETALKELISHLKKHAFPLLFDTYATDDSH